MNRIDKGVPAIRVLSVDDHPLMHQGIAAIIDNEIDMVMASRATSGSEALIQFRQHRPDITLMDLRLPDMSGIDAMSAILKEFPEARVIILTMSSGDVEINKALKSGARGYVLKSMAVEELVEVIRKVHGGRKHIPLEIASNLAEHMGEEFLTKREIEVLELLGGGNRNRDIAEKLFISDETVKVHVRNILDKLSATDRTHAVAIAIRRGIIQL